MMRVVTCVVMVTAAVLALVDAAPQTGAPLGLSRPETSSLVMTTLAQELCVQDKARCVANVAKCLEDQRPAKPSNCSVWKQQMVANVTTCAKQLGYPFTAPPSSEDISLSIEISESGESSESSEEAYQYYDKTEIFLKKTNFRQEQLVPMVRCLLTENQMLENFRSCVNQ